MKNRRRFTITVGAVLMVCMLGTGYAAVAAEYSASDDPLITQKYRDQVLIAPFASVESTSEVGESGNLRDPSVLERHITEMSQALDNKIASLVARLSRNGAYKKPQADIGGASSETEAWIPVSIEPDRVLKLDLNAEVILQEGSAVCVESAGTGLVDLSEGGVLQADASLTLAHRYIATTQGAGLRASTKSTVLVYGGYTLS